MEKHEKVLIALRQIIRAIDLQSKHLNRQVGLTTPQLVLMQAIARMGQVTVRCLAEATTMSQATATIILDRLEERGLVSRARSEQDRRKVHARLTAAGESLLAQAPSALQDDFLARFDGLPDWEQHLLLSSLQRVASLMNAEQLDAAPLLALGKLTQEAHDKTGA